MPPTIDPNYVTRVLQEMVQINSVNPSLVAGGNGEAEIAQYLADEMDSLGLEVDIQEVAPNRPNVIGTLKGSGGGRSLMLNGHTDTVGIEGMAAPFSGEIKDGKLYGRGAFDMKSGLAAALGAAKALVDADEKLAGDLVLAMVIDEEFHSLGTQALIEKYVTDGAIITEPTGLRLCVAHRGFEWFNVETVGLAAHGSRYQIGIDANRLMGHFLVELDQLADELMQRTPHELLGLPSIHAPVIKGGSSQAVYAATCLTEIERRTLPNESTEQTLGEIQGILDKLSQTVPNFNATVQHVFSRPAFTTSPDAPISQAVIQAYEQQFDQKPDIYGEQFWMDSGILTQVDIDTVIIGVVGGGAHADVEWIEVDSVVKLTDILLQSSIRYCNGQNA